jgi:DNA-directed RNA polymerase omega subunit
MIYPSIDELTRGIYNRYELVIATAKAARKITEIQSSKREEMEKNASKDPSPDKAYARFEYAIINDEKAVKTAIQKIYNGEFIIKTD